MSNAIVRLLECLRSPTDALVLGAGIIREIAYHALCGPLARELFSMLTRQGPLARFTHCSIACTPAISNR